MPYEEDRRPSSKKSPKARQRADRGQSPWFEPMQRQRSASRSPMREGGQSGERSQRQSSRSPRRSIPPEGLGLGRNGATIPRQNSRSPRRSIPPYRPEHSDERQSWQESSGLVDRDDFFDGPRSPLRHQVKHSPERSPKKSPSRPRRTSSKTGSKSPHRTQSHKIGDGWAELGRPNVRLDMLDSVFATLPELKSREIDTHDSDDEWERCWKCDGPIRKHWDECPALGCGAALAEARPGLAQPRADPATERWKPETTMTEDLREDTKPKKDEDYLSTGHSRLAPQSAGVDDGWANGHAEHGTVATLPRTGSEESLDLLLNALPKRRDLPLPDTTGPEQRGGVGAKTNKLLHQHFDLVEGDNKGGRALNNADNNGPHADVFKRTESTGDGRHSPSELPPAMNDFDTSALNNAGGEALGAVKAPDWMQVKSKDGGQSPLRFADGTTKEGVIWRVHFNDAEANQSEDKNEVNGSGTLARTDNAVVTAKYTVTTFLPTNLYMQFSRLANLYFLLIASLQVFTPFSPTGKFSTALPLTIVVLANMARELWEDSHRHRDDAEVNRRKAEVIRVGMVEEEMWRNLRVGDIVWVKKGQELPADVVQLSSSNDSGGSYVDTCNLDGETNLKIKQSLAATASSNTHALVSKLSGTLEYEGPNKRLYTFNGKALVNNKKCAVDNESVLLRGSVLRNTAWVYGLVVYAGQQSKIQLNSKQAGQKMSNLEKVANRVLAAVLVFLVLVNCTAVLCHRLWHDAKENEAMWHTPEPDTMFGTFIVYLILCNNYIPISLYFTMEIAKLGQKMLIDGDIEMYHKQTDTPALARTSNLNEELGQIEYIFSDKTGTLTRNEMEFRKCWVCNTCYGFGTTEIGAAARARDLRAGIVVASDDPAEMDRDKAVAQYHFDPAIEFDDVRIRKRLEDETHPDRATLIDFLRVLSVSHTVVPEGDQTKASKIKYQAESPDEGALVLAAKCLGFFFCDKVCS